MRRILIVVAYDGTNYHGWQVQDNGNTIEGELNRAISTLTGEVIEVIGASRTDSGVHGLCNRAVFDTASTIPAERFYAAINSNLPDDIRVISSKEVHADWHPRKCKTYKTYEYCIDCGDVANPLASRYSWHVRGPLNLTNMQESAKFLLGEHDFTSFCSVNGTALTNVREIFSIDINVNGRGWSTNPDMHIDGGEQIIDDGKITIRVTGNGFLYNMVRIIAGTLVHAGMGRFQAAEIANILEALDRTKAGPTAPPQGLTLVHIKDV